MKLMLQHDHDFGVEVVDFSGDGKVVAKAGAQFMHDNELFYDDEYEHGTDVLEATLGAILGRRFSFDTADLRRAIRRLVEPGGYLVDEHLQFDATVTEEVEA